MNDRSILAALFAATSAVACGGESDVPKPLPSAPSTTEEVSAPLAGFSVLDSATKQARIVDMLKAFVPVAEARFIPASSPPSCATSDRYDAALPGVDEWRGQSGIAYGYATLLHATSEPTLGGFPRGVIQSHLIAVLNHLVCSYNEGAWGGPVTFNAAKVLSNWQAGIIAFELGWAARVLNGDVPNGPLAASVKTVVTTQANALLPPNMIPQWLRPGDSHAEDNAWDSSLLALAAATYPNEPNAAAWDLAAKSFAINASTRSADLNDSTSIDGQALSSWITVPPASMGVVTRWNLGDDYTMTNHKMFHPVYSQGVIQNLFDDQVFYAAASRPLPQAFSFRVPEVWENVMGRFSWNDGDFVLPAGTDWVNRDYQHLPYLAGMATVFHKDDASVMESRAITTLLARQQAHAGSFYGMPIIGYETDIFRNLAQAWWIHQLLGPSPTPTSEQYQTAFSHWDGKYEWPGDDRKTIVLRGQKAFVSMSWMNEGQARPTALIVPSSEGFLDDPVFVQYFQHSGVGTAAGAAIYHAGCSATDPAILSTTSEIVGSTTTKFSATAWSDGATILLHQGTGDAFTFAFDDDPPGLNGPRPAYFADGTHTATAAGEAVPGSWMNMANRFGLLSRGHLGFLLQRYPDVNEDDAIFDPHIRIEAHGDTTVRNRGALILPLATAEQTAHVDADTSQPVLSAANWSALSGRALDGTGRLAVTRWDGGATTNATLTSSLGAPIPGRPADVVVQGSTGTTTFSIGTPDCSAGYTQSFWAQASAGSVTVRPISETIARLTNTGTVSSTVTMRYADGTGNTHVGQAALAPGGVGFAHAIDETMALVLASATSSGAPHGPSEAFDGAATPNGYWISAPVDLATSPQDLTLDFGKPIDLGGITMMPRAGQGPKTYDLLTSDSGTTGSFVTRLSVNAPNADTSSMFTSPLRARFLRLHVTSGWALASQGVAIRELAILKPTIDIDALDATNSVASSGNIRMRLAKGGYGLAMIRVRNNGSTATSVTVNASAPSPITVAAVGATTVTVQPQASTNVLFSVVGAGATPISGLSLLTVTATNAATEFVDLLHTDNLALNDTGATFPKALASTEDLSFLYSARLANDGDVTGSSNFWVTAPVDLSTAPQCWIVDLGSNETVGRAVMTPRTNYGPRDFTIQTATSVTNVADCTSQTGWTTRSTAAGAANGAVITSAFSPIAARYVRVRVTSTWYRGAVGAPPSQPQIRELQVYPN